MLPASGPHNSTCARPAPPAGRYEKMATDFNLGYGEVAAALLRICKYALARFK